MSNYPLHSSTSASENEEVSVDSDYLKATDKWIEEEDAVSLAEQLEADRPYWEMVQEHRRMTS